MENIAGNCEGFCAFTFFGTHAGEPFWPAQDNLRYIGICLDVVEDCRFAEKTFDSRIWRTWMRFADATFDIATSVYLFHELPRNARRNVVREMFRVLKPGGLIVIEDSAQLSESAELATVLREFPREFHEPFYAKYLEDDLAALLREAGFVVESTEAHLVAKVVVARRPG